MTSLLVDSAEGQQQVKEKALRGTTCTYLVQPADELSDSSHTAKIHGTFAKSDQGPQTGLDHRTFFSRR
jgi:hypothetical protein